MRRGLDHLALPIKKTEIAFLGVLGGLSAGANAVGTPAKIPLPPGAEGTVTASDQGLTLQYGPTELYMPNADLGIPGINGINVDITSLEVPVTDPHALQQYAALIEPENSDLVSPFLNAWVEHVGVNALQGSGATIVVGGLAISCMRLIRQKRELEQRVKELESPPGPSSVSEPRSDLDTVKASQEKKYRLQPKLATILAGLAIAGCGVSIQQDLSPSVSHPTTPFAPNVASKTPVLQGATISDDPIGRIVNVATFGAEDYRKSTESTMQVIADNLEAEFDALAAQGQLDVLNDPDIERVMHVTDFQCNHATYKHTWGIYLRKLRPNIIINTGDTELTTDSPDFLDCYGGFTEGVAKAEKELNMPMRVGDIRGNHDKKVNVKMSHPNVITLGTAKIDGFTFVGSMDAEDTTFDPPDRDQTDKLEAEIQKRGIKLADEACRITQRDPQNIPPIVAVHRYRQAKEAARRNCALGILTGHTHHEDGVRLINYSQGQPVFHHNGGSISGNSNRPSFSIYEPPQQEANVTLFLFNKTSRAMVGYITSTVHTNNKVTIKVGTPPTKLESIDYDE